MSPPAIERNRPYGEPGSPCRRWHLGCSKSIPKSFSERLPILRGIKIGNVHGDFVRCIAEQVRRRGAGVSTLPSGAKRAIASELFSISERKCFSLVIKSARDPLRSPIILLNERDRSPISSLEFIFDLRISSPSPTFRLASLSLAIRRGDRE